MTPQDASFDATLLVIDDDETNRRVLTKLLQRDGYRSIEWCESAENVLSKVIEVRPKLLLLDLHMPGRDGFDVMQELHGQLSEADCPQIVVLTGDQSRDVRHRALAAGASDFLTKPYDHLEVLLRVRNLLRMRALQEAIARHNDRLEAEVRARTAELDRTQIEILERLARAAEHRDDDTGQHTRRVGELSARIARHLGLSSGTVELIRRAALLHDVGKIGVPDSVLLKSGPLEPGEREIMQRHTRYGGEILADSESELLRMAETIAVSHHEWWDGSGYPAGTAGVEIPLVGRIVAVADAFDALTHERPYKKAWSVDEALAEIASLAGRQFDPDVATALRELVVEV